MNKLAFLPAATFMLFAGCSRPSVSTLPYCQMADCDLVALVNGVGYTKGELERDVAITEKLLALSGLPQEEMVSRRDPQAFRRSVVSGFVAREVLLNEARRRHVELLPADMADFQDQFADEISSRLPLGFNALLEALGKDATAFRNNLKKDALSAKMERAVKRQIAETLPTPTPAEVAQARQDALAANRRIEADNRTLFRLATNAWKSVRAGNDFAVVAGKLPSLHRGIAFEADYRDTTGRFRNAAVGTLTAPAAFDGGLEVVNVSLASDGSRRISRLLFRPEDANPPPSAEETSNALRIKAVNARYAALLKELRKSADVSVAAL